MPWANVTYPQAVAACTSIGARLCTEAEWQNMCSRPVAPTYPVAGPAGATDYVFIEAENAQNNAVVGGKTWTSDTIQNFSGVKDFQALPNSGTNVTAANAPANSARLDFQINFTSTGNYFVWVRMFAANGNDNTIYTGINAAVPGVVSSAALSPALVTQWTWVVGAAVNVTATGNRFVSVYMGKDGVRVDAIAVSKDGVDLPPFTQESWAYASNIKLPQPQLCNDHEFDTNSGVAGDQDDILPTGSMGSCFANGGGANTAFDMAAT